MTWGCAFCAMWRRPAADTEIWRDDDVLLVLDVAPRQEGQLVAVPSVHGTSGIQIGAAGLPKAFEILKHAGYGRTQAMALLQWRSGVAEAHAAFVVVPGTHGAAQPVGRRTPQELRQAASFLRMVVAELPGSAGQGRRHR